MAQNTQIPRDQRSQFENNTFSKKISMEVLGLCLPDVETYFKEQHWSPFQFMVQIFRIL